MSLDMTSAVYVYSCQAQGKPLVVPAGVWSVHGALTTAHVQVETVLLHVRLSLQSQQGTELPHCIIDHLHRQGEGGRRWTTLN